ncbi:chorismate binding enzyme family protein [Mycobacterium kansasii]|uniref:Chorismate binding enzyme family protein n=1 Tax=Mycobacterium kansasii TaxID=1768 RepID=A0A1V3XW35_MYCKA|nr:chorismate binding enzyme family protein [Mycobacterium kansasii]
MRARYRDIRAAQAALRSGSVPMIVGALPFDVSEPAALMVPTSVQRLEALPGWPTGPLSPVHISAAIPPLAEHRARISYARDQLAVLDNPLRKVVLARALRLTADAPLDARVILRRLVAADPASYGYLVDLSAAGDDYLGAALVGASPELLVARSGDRVTCQPFAGSAPVLPTPKSTPPMQLRWPARPRTGTSISWLSTRCTRPWNPSATTWKSHPSLN